MWATSLWSHDWIILQWGVVIAASLIALVCDIDRRRIPNALTGPLALAGAVWAMWIGGLGGLADAVVACLIMAGPCLLLFLFAGGGAGDAKMMGALGLWLGVVNGLAALTAVMLAGAVWGVGVSLARRRLAVVLRQAAEIAWRPAMLLVGGGEVGRPAERIAPASDRWTLPYAVAIFTGVCATAGGVILWRA